MGRHTKLEIWVAGRMRVVAQGGHEIAIRGQRRQALVLLLATAPGLQRSRAFVQDKLWSEKEQHLGSASLRQTLSEVRQALGKHRNTLTSDDGWIGFDKALVDVRFDPIPSSASGGCEPAELAEGLDVDDPEFEDWLRNERSAFASRAPEVRSGAAAHPASVFRPQLPKPILLLGRPEGIDPQMQMVADMVATEVGYRVSRLGGVDVREAAGFEPDQNGAPQFLLAVRVAPSGSLLRVQASISDRRTAFILWSGQHRIDPSGSATHNDEGFGRIVNNLTAKLCIVLGTPAPDATDQEIRAIAAYRAIAGLKFSCTDGLLVADEFLREANAMHPNATVTAWRALVTGWQVIERVAPQDALDHAIDLSRQALAGDPVNPTALTVAAELSDIRGGPFDAAELAQQAVDLDPIDAFVAAGLAKALMRRGDAARAHERALLAAQLARGHPNLPWWKMLCSVTAVHCGKYGDALRFAKTAHDLAPNFRPPLRYLVGLYFQAGDEQAVVETAAKLQRFEPDFGAAALRDPQYPLRLGGTPLLDVADSGLI